MDNTRCDNTIERISESLHEVAVESIPHNNNGQQQPWDMHAIYIAKDNLRGRYCEIKAGEQLYVSKGFSFPSEANKPENILGDFALLLTINPDSKPFIKGYYYFFPNETEPIKIAAEGIYHYISGRDTKGSTRIKTILRANNISWRIISDTPLVKTL